MNKKLIACIKDIYIMEMYYHNFDDNSTIINGLCYTHTNIDRGWLHDEIVNYIGTGKTNNLIKYSKKKFLKYNIKIEHINKCLNELIADRYLKRAGIDDNLIFFCDKGKQHHLNEKSFETDYINNKKLNYTLYLALFAIIVSAIIPYIPQIFNFIKIIFQ